MFWRELSEQSAIATGNFAKLFGGMEIPPLPQAALQLIELASDEECSVDEAAKLISGDPGISAKIMRSVNSVGMGLAVKVADVRGAVGILGLKRIQLLAVGFATASALPRSSDVFDGAKFWQASVQRAVLAEALASEVSPGNEGEAFTGALLEDMAQPILLTQWRRHYVPVIERARESGRALDAVEDEELSWNHAQADAWLARSWGFPDVLVCCIGLHHAGLEGLEQVGLEHSQVAAVAAASLLPDVTSLTTLCLEQLEIAEGTLLELFESADQAAAELADLFGVDTPPPLAASAKGSPA